ncbi:hypothetical protein HanPSC8_Chr14g0619361 [Helianthus annuus]|nr:hypothetical protein HanPSC8_Chr14g0619361 [Helianthus annuus]
MLPDRGAILQSVSISEYPQAVTLLGLEPHSLFDVYQENQSIHSRHQSQLI